jgi:hypothetical protein
MKMMIKMFSATVLFLMIASCVTTTPIALPAKYNLDNDLMAVTHISAYKISNWDQVDNQSFIITANGSEHYLLILDQPMQPATPDQRVGLTNSGSSITAGINTIFVRNTSGLHHYVIGKIYKIEGREQAEKIKDQLSK